MWFSQRVTRWHWEQLMRSRSPERPVEDGDIIVISFGGSKEGLEAVKEGKLNVTFECNPNQGPKAAELIQRLESDISIDKEQYVEETYFDTTMDLDEIIGSRTY